MFINITFVIQLCKLRFEKTALDDGTPTIAIIVNFQLSERDTSRVSQVASDVYSSFNKVIIIAINQVLLYFCVK